MGDLATMAGAKPEPLKCHRIEERPRQFICHSCTAMWFQPADDDAGYRPLGCPQRQAKSALVKE